MDLGTSVYGRERTLLCQPRRWSNNSSLLKNPPTPLISLSIRDNMVWLLPVYKSVSYRPFGLSLLIFCHYPSLSLILFPIPLWGYFLYSAFNTIIHVKGSISDEVIPTLCTMILLWKIKYTMRLYLGVTEVCKWGHGFLKNKQFEITIYSRQFFL